MGFVLSGSSFSTIRANEPPSGRTVSAITSLERINASRSWNRPRCNSPANAVDAQRSDAATRIHLALPTRRVPRPARILFLDEKQPILRAKRNIAGHLLAVVDGGVL